MNEPRGSDPLVGALLVKPHRADCALGVIFFNNVGYLGMCGHGTIGLIASLKFAGKLEPGALKIDTPVGAVAANCRVDGRISVDNVVSYRVARAAHGRGSRNRRGGRRCRLGRQLVLFDFRARPDASICSTSNR